MSNTSKDSSNAASVLALVPVYETRAREVASAREAGRLLAQAGWLSLKGGEAERAEQLFHRGHALAPALREPIDGLLALARQRQDSAAEIDALEALAAVQQGRASADTLLSVAGRYEAAGQPARAVLACQLAARADPSLRSAYERARAILLADERLGPVFDFLDKQRAALGDAELGADVLRVCELAVLHPSEHTRATGWLKWAAQQDALRSRATALLMELGGVEHSWRERLAQITARAAEAAPKDPRGAARLYMAAARLNAHYETNPALRLSDALDRALAAWPGMPEAIELLERVADAAGNAGALVPALAKLARDAKDPAGRVDVLLRAGRFALTRAAQPSVALELFLEASAAEPGRAEAAELAVELLVDAGRVAEAVQILGRHAATVKSRARAVALRLTLAELVEKHLKAPAQVRQQLDAARAVDPYDADVAFRLAKVSADADDAEAAWAVAELAASATRPAAERVTLGEYLSLMFAEADQPERAFYALAWALPLEPGRPGLLANVVEAAGKAKVQAPLIIVLRRALEAAAPAERAPLLRALAVAHERQGSLTAALAAAQELASAAPDEGDVKPLVERLVGAIAAAPPDARAELDAQAQQIEATASGAVRLAGLYQRMLALDPNDTAALERIAQLASLRNEWPQATDAARRLVAVSGTPEARSAWRLKLAQWLAEGLGEAEEAARIYLGLLEDGDTSAAVLGGLERLAASQVRATDIALALAPVHAKAGSQQRQRAGLLVQLDAAQAPAEQQRLLSLLAQAAELEPDGAQAAFEYQLRAIAVGPEQEAPRREALRLGRQVGALRELGRVLAAESAKRPVDELGRVLALEAASALREAGAADDAAAVLRAALERWTDDVELMRQLAGLYAGAQRWGDYEQLVRRRFGSAEGDEKRALALELADLNEQRLGSPKEAAQALQQAIALGADEGQHLPRLGALFEAAGLYREVTEVQDRLIARLEAQGDAATAKAIAVNRARILETVLGDTGQAIARYADVLRSAPTDEAALGALEALFSEPVHGAAAARAVLGAAKASSDKKREAQALSALAQASKDVAERVATLKELAEVHAELEQPEQAFFALATAVRLAPSDAGVRALARSAAEDADVVDSYTEVLEEMIQGAAPLDAALFNRELADIFERKLDDRPGALRCLEACLAIDPKNTEALRALARLHRGIEQWIQLVGVLERLAALETDPAVKDELDREAAAINEAKIHDAEQATEHWRHILERNVQAKDAAVALERLYAELDRPSELAFALEIRRNQEAGAPLARELTVRLAALRKDRLQDPAGALELLRQVLGDEPGHPGAQAALEALIAVEGTVGAQALEALDAALLRTGDHQRRLALREQRLAHAGTAEERAKLAKEVRAILERDLEQPEAAFMQALKAFTDGIDRAGVQPDLERLAEQTGSFEELAEIYESCADELPATDPERGKLLRRAAELRGELGDVDEAIRLWKVVLEATPDDRPALDTLAKLYERSENARSLAEVSLTKAKLADAPAEKVDLFGRAADSFESAGDEVKALEALQALLAIERQRPRLVQLERVLGRLHRSEERAGVLGELAARTADEAQRVELLLKQAGVLVDDERFVEALKVFHEAMSLAPTDPRALTAIERLLHVDATRLEAARLLEPSYRQLSDRRKLVEVLELRLSGTDESRRLPLLLEMAALRESLGQKAQALSALLRAFQLAPGDSEVRGELERLATELGAFEELAGAYEDLLERGVDDSMAMGVSRRLAQLYAERLGRPDLAANALEQLLAQAPKDAAALRALADVHRRGNVYKELAVVLRRLLGVEADVGVQIDLLYELADIAEERLADKALAAQCYRAILERAPDDSNASQLLGRVLGDSERNDELATLLQGQLSAAQAAGREEEVLDLKVRLGRLKATKLGDAQAALTLFQEVLARRPAHAGAVGALEEMARSDNPMKGAAASTLEPVFANEGDHLKLVQMLEARVASEADANERAALLRKMAEVYRGEMDNVEMAFVAATRALREQPQDPANLALCVELAGVADTGDELLLLLQEVAPKTADDRARGELWRAAAKLQMQAGEDEDAVTSWRHVLESNPTDSEATGHMGSLLGQQGRAPELLEVLKRQLTVEEDTDKRVALMFQLGSLQADQLKDLPAATTTFRRLLELKPDDPAALAKLDALCEAQQRWPELADVLARRIRATPAAQQTDLLYRLGAVREARLLDKTGAVELYRQILGEQPRHPQALGRLEAIAQREPQNQLAAEGLLEAYRKTGDLAKLSQLLEARAKASPDSLERKTLLMELATIRDGQDEPELAYLALYRAFKEDPNDPELRKRLEAAADAAESYDELAHAYEAELPRIGEPEEAAKVWLKLGELQEQKLGDTEAAVGFYEKARGLSQGAAAKALPALDRLYGQLEDSKSQADAVEALANLSTEPAERVALFFRLGQLAMDRLDSPDRAAAAFEQVLAADPKHLPALRSLEILYEQAKMSEQLYRTLEAQRELVQGPERERVLGKMAGVSAEGLADVEHSISLYRELLSKNPRNEQAFESLNQLLDAAKRYEELVALLQQKLAVTIDPRELVRLNERLGRVFFERLDRPDDAVTHFRAALERDPRHRGALEALRDLFDKADKKEDLIIVLKRLIPLQEDASGVKAIRIRLAETVAQTQRREEALDNARRALEVEPHATDDLDRLHAVFLQLKAYSDAVRALEAKSQTLLKNDDREGAVRALFEVIALWRGPANRPDNAGAVVEKILEIAPANREAFELGLELYSKANDWRSYANALDRFVPQLVTEEERLETLRELGRVQEVKLGQKDVAFLQYCRALQIQPGDDYVREQVERLADETGSHDELAAVYEEVADSVPRGPLAERMYLTLARVQDEKLDDETAAEESLRKILEFDPTNTLALDRLSQMFSRRGKDKEYVVALEQKLEAAPSIEARKEILREIARIYEEKLEDQDEAENALGRALALDPDLTTLGTLVSLQRRRKDFTAVASTLLRMRDIAPTPEERAQLQVDIAQVYERDLEDDEAAVQGYRQALEFDPANQDALGALEKLYTKLDRPGDLLAVYERELELTQDYRERVKLLFKSAAIWEERYQNLANADACIDSALNVDGSNLQAIKTLERLRKAQGRWDELIGVVDRHIQLVTDPVEKAELLVEMGDIFHQQLEAVDRAVTTYHQALELDPRCRPALHALGTLYERSGNWPFALDMLGKEAEVLGPTNEAVELHFRMGKISEDMLIDPANAKASYLEALKIDPGYLPAIRALKGIYELEKDDGAYEKALIEEARRTEDPKEKAKAHVEVAKYYEQKEDKDTAAEFYEEALLLDEHFIDAAKPLADIYLQKENWDGCERMLDIVTAQLTQEYVDHDQPEVGRELCTRSYRLGYVCEKLGKRDKALEAYERAYQLDATNLPVLEGYGHLLGQAKRYEEGLKVLQSILVHHRGDLTDLEVAEIHYTLGDYHLKLKQAERAENQFEKTLAIDSGHEPALRAMVQLTETAQQWDRAVDFRQRLLAVVEGEQKYEVGVALAKLARTKANDHYVAIEAYLQAFKVRADLDVMDALYMLYRETKQGAKAADMLEKMLGAADLQKDTAKSKRVWFALGEICRDELGDLDRAVGAFNKALDLDWRFIEAFSAIEALLGKNKKWKSLDDNYKRMLGRFPKTDETHAARMAIWKALGDLYLNVMKAPDAAAEVYKVVATGQPDNVEIQELYASVAQTQKGHEEAAVDAWRRALPTTSNPGKVASALATIFAGSLKRYDSAFLAAQVVGSLIGEPGPGEKEILTKLTPYAKKREVASRQLTDRLWQEHLFHPKVRGPLSELMGILFEQAGVLYKEDFAKFNVNPKRHLIDVQQAPEYQLHHFRYVSRLLGMEQVSLFSPFLVVTRDRLAKRTAEPAPDPMIGVEVLPTDPIALRVGGKFFAETGQREVYYLLGRAMAFLRPELALANRLSAERIEAIVQAAVSLFVERFRFTADLRALDVERKLLERNLPEAAKAALSRVVREYVKAATPNDLRNYLEGAELSATRTGAFVAGELEPVKRMVLAESGSTFRVPSRSKMRDLMVFALSDDLHKLRVAVGTSVEIQARK